MKFNDVAKQLLIWGAIVIVAILVFNSFGPHQTEAQKLSYSAFLTDVDNGNVGSVTFEQNNISGTLTSGQKFETYSPTTDYSALVNKLMKNNIEINAEPPAKPSL
ncbi:MAG: ATP-dependent metallopeptidase FtsH/Yme1/Tma family protein, partial [Gammaproteobacteria bacterium]